MSVNVHVDLKSLNNISARFERGQIMAGNQAMLEMSQYVPMREENLRDSGTLSPDGKTVSYHEPYAKAQFYGFVNGSRVRNYTTAGTSRRWDLRMKGNRSKMNNVTQAFTRGAGF